MQHIGFPLWSRGSNPGLFTCYASVLSRSHTQPALDIMAVISCMCVRSVLCIYMCMCVCYVNAHVGVCVMHMHMSWPVHT